MHVKIIGGGLAGLIAGIMLNRSGRRVSIYEQKSYPFHRVCGEYISNEVRPFLTKNGLFPNSFQPAEISHFRMSSVAGKEVNMPLDLGGFGISRYQLDLFLAEIARQEGVEIREKTQVIDVRYENEKHQMLLQDGSMEEADILLGAFGKRSKIDKSLSREFLNKEAGYIGVKYHVRIDYPEDLVALHNFPGGYCGINRVENGIYNLCYLAKKKILKISGNIAEMEAKYLHKNPRLREIWQQAEFLWEKPEVINEVSFAPKKPVENGILMLGDAAGLITPLCGNGMAMAIHAGAAAAKLLSATDASERMDPAMIEKKYSEWWQRLFGQRLWVGRATQRLFGAPFSSDLAVQLMQGVPVFARTVMRNTHGEAFEEINLNR